MHTHAVITTKLPTLVKQTEKKFDFKQFVRDTKLDNSEFIKYICDSAIYRLVFKFPAGSGKTINLLTLKHFFESKSGDPDDILENMSISKEPKYTQLRGKHPVFFLDFADLVHGSFMNNFKNYMSELYKQYIHLKSRLMDHEKAIFEAVIAGGSTNVELAVSLVKLMKYIKRSTDVQSILLIDNYDKVFPLDKYEFQFIRSILESVFKCEGQANPLHFGCAMGLSSADNENARRTADRLFPTNGRIYSIEVEECAKYFSHSQSTPKLTEVPSLELSNECKTENPTQTVTNELTENEPLRALSSLSLRPGMGHQE